MLRVFFVLHVDKPKRALLLDDKRTRTRIRQKRSTYECVLGTRFYTSTLGSFRPNTVPRVYQLACAGCATTTSQADRKLRKTLSIIVAPAPITRSPVPTTNPYFRVGRDRYRATLSSFFPFPSFADYGWKWERRECLEICKNDRGLREISFALKIRLLCFTIGFFFHLPFSFLFLSYAYNYART